MKKQTHCPSFEIEVNSFDPTSSVIALNGLSRHAQLVDAFVTTLRKQDEGMSVRKIQAEDGEISIEARGIHSVAPEYAWPYVANRLGEEALKLIDDVTIVIKDSGHKIPHQVTDLPIER